MAQQVSQIPPTGLWQWSARDFWKGALVTVFGHLVAIVIFLIRQDHWPLWVEWQPYIEITVYTFLVYMGKQLGTNNVGELFTKDKPVVTVSEEKLDELQSEADATKG